MNLLPFAPLDTHHPEAAPVAALTRIRPRE